jgi:3-oxoadipate enol-lactonase
MPSVEIDGISIHYRLDGPERAPTLVLSSSLGTSHQLWEPQLPALASRLRVLRYDHRGHGASSVPPGPYRLEALARDVLGLVDGLGIAQFLFCGISMGGMVGMWLGVNAPARVQKLVLCNTGARIGTRESWEARIGPVQAGGMAAIADAVLARWFTPAFQAAHPEGVARARRMLLETPPEGYVAACAAIRDADLREEVARIGAPTLVIAGSADAATPPADGRFLAERIGSARYLELNAAHLSNIEADEPFTNAVLAFLEDGDDA